MRLFWITVPLVLLRLPRGGGDRSDPGAGGGPLLGDVPGVCDSGKIRRRTTSGFVTILPILVCAAATINYE